MSHLGSPLKLPYNPAIPLLGNSLGKPYTCIPMFTAALCTTARKWKQPRRPLIHERTKKLWNVCIMEYYSAIKRNAFESVLTDREGRCATVHGVTKSQTWLSDWVELNWLGVDEPRAYYTQWSKSERERQTSSINTSIWKSRKTVLDEPIWRAEMEMQTENRLVDTLGEG